MMKYVKRVDEADKMAMSYKLSNDDKHDVEFMWFKEMKKKHGKKPVPSDIKEMISQKLGINYFEVSSYIDREILDESVNEGREKQVTKIMWDRQMTNDQKETALLSVFEDPDDAEKWIEAKYDDLPPQTSHMYTEKLEAYPLAKEPFHGSGDLGKEIKPVKKKNKMKTLKTFEQFSGGIEEVDEGKCPEKGCTKKVGDKWRVISNKTGKLWPQHYDTEKDAKAAIMAYHS